MFKTGEFILILYMSSEWYIQPQGDYADKMDWVWWTAINMLLHTNNSEGVQKR